MMDDDMFYDDSDFENENQITKIDNAKLEILEEMSKLIEICKKNITQFFPKRELSNNFKVLSDGILNMNKIIEIENSRDISDMSDDEIEEELELIHNTTVQLDIETLNRLSSKDNGDSSESIVPNSNGNTDDDNFDF